MTNLIPLRGNLGQQFWVFSEAGSPGGTITAKGLGSCRIEKRGLFAVDLRSDGGKLRVWADSSGTCNQQRIAEAVSVRPQRKLQHQWKRLLGGAGSCVQGLVRFYRRGPGHPRKAARDSRPGNESPSGASAVSRGGAI